MRVMLLGTEIALYICLKQIRCQLVSKITIVLVMKPTNAYSRTNNYITYTFFKLCLTQMNVELERSLTSVT